MRLNLIAAFCSTIITGSGQIIKRDGEKGVALLLIFYFVLPAALYLSLLFSGLLFPYIFGFIVIFGIILWAYNIWDALVRT